MVRKETCIGTGADVYRSVKLLAAKTPEAGLADVNFLTTGGSIGGIVFPLMFESLQPIYGFAWAMRACALVIFTLAVSFLLCLARS